MTMRRTSNRATASQDAEGSDSDEFDDGDTVPLGVPLQAQGACSGVDKKVSSTTGSENVGSGEREGGEEDVEGGETGRLIMELEQERGLRVELERQKCILEIQVESVMKDFDSKLQGKGQEIAALNGMNAHLQSQVNELQCLLNEEKGKNSSSAGSTSSSASSPSLVTKELQSKVASLEDELKDGEELLTGLESENDAIRKELEEAHNNIQDLDDERSETHSQIKALEKELESAVVEINELKENCRRKGEAENVLKGEVSAHLQLIGTLEAQAKYKASEELKTEAERKEMILSLQKQLSEATSAEAARDVIGDAAGGAGGASERETKAVRDAAFAAARVMELEQELDRVKMESAEEAKIKQEQPSKGTAETGVKNGANEVLTESMLEKDSLVRELNILTEEKLSCESRANTAEKDAMQSREELHATRQELSKMQLDVNSQEIAARAKEKEIVEVRSEATATRDALIDSQKQVKKLEKKVTTLEEEASKKEDVLAELENDLFQLKQEAEAASNETSSHQVSTLQAEVQQLSEDLTTKNARIERLEKSKLTKDQLDKIKAIKEEKVRLTKENKRLTAQLEASSSSSSSEGVGGGGDGAEAKELQVQLKDKAFQVEEYERERQNILQVLEKEGFNVAKHQDSSFNLDSTMDHSDLCISSSLAGIIDDLRRGGQKISDSEEIKSLEEENISLLKENRSLRRQLEREKRTSFNSSFTSQHPSADNTPSHGHGSSTKLDLDKENAPVADKENKRAAFSALDSDKRGKASTAKKSKPMLSEVKE